MRIYIALIIFLLLGNVTQAVSFSPNDIQWAPAVTGTLYKGNSLTNGEYTVTAVQLASPVAGYKNIDGNVVPEKPVEPSVLLDIYKNGVFVREIVMTLQSEAYKDPDYEVMISATEFTAKSGKDAQPWVYEFYNPWAKVSLSLRGKPKLETTVTTDKATYTSHSDLVIIAKVTVKNTGHAFAQNVDVKLDIGDLTPRSGNVEEFHKKYLRMEKDATQTFDAIILVPGLINEKIYTLRANTICDDLKDIEYNFNGTLNITVSPQQNYFTINKAVRDRMYLRNTATVMITVQNAGIYDISNIYIKDSMNENFDLKTQTPLEWNISLLKPGQDWSTIYSIKPLEASLTGYKIPAATANFTLNNKQLTASSLITTMVVNGPKIILNKTVSKSVVNMSELVTVTVSLKNVGDIGSRFEVKDTIPEGVNLAGGSTSLTEWLDANSVQGFSYNISIENEGQVELPSAVLNYTSIEYRGTTREVQSSEKPALTIVDPTKPRIEAMNQSNPSASSSSSDPSTQSQSSGQTPAPGETIEPTPTPLTPATGISFSIIILFLAAGLRRT